MKKFRKIMAVLVAAIMIISSFTLTAFADDPQGRLEADYGTITIDNPHSGSVYNIYRMFELASFIDPAPQTGNHADTEHYSYVIKEANTASWYYFLTNYGPSGPADPTNGKYAYAYVDSGSTETAEVTKRNNAYFVIDAAKVSLTTADGSAVENNYHIIKAGEKFKHALNESAQTTGIDDMSPATGRTAEPGVGIDYVDTAATNYNRVVQDFAQEALKYATTGFLTTPAVQISPQYSPKAKITDGAVPNIVVGSTVTDEQVTALETDENYLIKDNLPLGYYLISSTMGTLATLDTTNPNATVHDKNDEPTIDKKILKKDADALKAQNAYEGENKINDYRTAYFSSETGTNWVANTDKNVGEYVQFRIKIRAQQGMQEYRIHDVMEKGLTLVKSGDADYTNHPVTVKMVRYIDKTGSANGRSADSPVLADISKTYDVPATYSVSNTEYTNWEFVLPNANGTAGSLEKMASDEHSSFILRFVDADGAAAGNDKVVFYAKDESGSTTNPVDIKDDDYIFVYYWAKLNADAAIYGNEPVSTGKTTEIQRNIGRKQTDAVEQNYEANGNGRNDNHAILTYGNKNTEVTTWTTASVTTYGIDLVKTDEADKLLGGAKFNLYKATSTTTKADGVTYDFTYTSGGTSTYFKKVDATPLKFDQSTKYLYNATTGDAEIQTDAKAETYIRGLEAGTYLLEEILAPMGYDKLAYPIAIVINPDANNDGKVPGSDSPLEGNFTIYHKTNKNTFPAVATITNWNAGITNTSGVYTYEDQFDFDGAGGNDAIDNGGLRVVNYTGQELPSTGGMGTTVLYIVGGMMVVLAGAYLFFSKRRNAA